MKEKYGVKINSDKVVKPVSKDLYGIFFEDINRAGDGGLYAELIKNRAFDDGVIPDGCTYDKKSKCIKSVTGWNSSFDCYEGDDQKNVYGWTCQGNAKMEVTSEDTLNKNRKRALKVNFNGGKILNEGFDGICVKAGEAYRFYMFAKCDRAVQIKVSIELPDGKISASHIFEVSGNYKKYECQFVSELGSDDARLSISCDADCQVLFGFVSLFPKDTYMGRENGLRKSLAQRLIDLKPAFLRFPGGCVVEGFSKETAMLFEDSIGPAWERKPHWSLWGYKTTNGLGYHEYLQFCEDAGIDALYVCNCGMTCQARCPDFFDEDLTKKYLEDTVHAILYATAPAESEWGRKRAEAGHKEPFTCLKYIEIGNENWGEEYYKRYKVFYNRLKEQFPELIYISNCHTERAGLPTEYVDDHYYNTPVTFAHLQNFYDNAPENPKIYCGEYASTVGCKAGTLDGALGEALFLIGIERNQDKVRMTSYAPLFKNVMHVSWEPDLIIFNNHDDYVIPSYYLLKLFAENRGDYVCDYQLTTAYTQQLEDGTFVIPNEYKSVMKDIRIIDKSFSAVVCSDTFVVRFWDSGKVGEDQKHFDWKVENGKSFVTEYTGWTALKVCEEVSCQNIPSSKIEITIDDNTATLKINGKVLHKYTPEAIPDVSCVCTADNEKVITKAVNFSEKECEFEISYDGEMSNQAEVIVLTGDNPNAVNSFENKGNVSPISNLVTAGSDFKITLAPKSVNVIRHFKK